MTEATIVIRFGAGRLGLTCDESNGMVTSVERGHLAYRKGVRRGWRVISIGGNINAIEHGVNGFLRYAQRKAGGLGYEVVFAAPLVGGAGSE